MMKHGSLGATDVTGFGLLGHAANLSSNQTSSICIEINKLPIIGKMAEVDRHLGGMFRLEKGLSAETSGGLFLALESEEKAKIFIREMEEREGEKAWIVGKVVERDTAKHPKNTAYIVENPEIIQV